MLRLVKSLNQEKIGKIIKKIRQESGLTQEKFASKYNVTFQAVSKWENGKSLPDISILKNICEEYGYDINQFLKGEEIKRKNWWLIIVICFGVGLIILTSIILVQLNKKEDFNFGTLSTTCDNFKLFGTLAYSEVKTAIYINNITYCGNEKLEQFKTIDCILYENDGKTKTKISNKIYDEKDNITLEEFLKGVEFNIDNYSKSCKNFKENGLIMEIEGVLENGENQFYQIPLKIEENCN